MRSVVTAMLTLWGLALAWYTAVATTPADRAAPPPAPVPRETGEGGVHLPEGKGPAPAEVGVVIALQVVAVARFAIEEPEEGHGNTHTRENTLSVYSDAIVVRVAAEPARPDGAPGAGRAPAVVLPCPQGW